MAAAGFYACGGIKEPDLARYITVLRIWKILLTILFFFKLSKSERNVNDLDPDPDPHQNLIDPKHWQETWTALSFSPYNFS